MIYINKQIEKYKTISRASCIFFFVMMQNIHNFLFFTLFLDKKTYKKSLTWNSNLQSSITYFKEDCPLSLQKNE